MNYYPDLPKETESEDILEYSKFTDELFDYIKNFLNDEQSNIIGITGNWGDGKTTEINYIKDRIIAFYKKNKHITINLKKLIEFIISYLVTTLFFVFLLILINYTILAFFNNFRQILSIYLWIFILTSVYVLKNRHVFYRKFKNGIKQIFYKNDYTILDFNPWSCRDEKQVFEEFFRSLRSTVGKSSLLNNLNKYCNLIMRYKKIDLDVFTEDNSIKYLHDEIKENLKKSNKKIFVIIDDLDRMTGCEIFNVLKLIKVVADFPNIIYILAYNKDYVVSELSSIIKYNADEYLEKIVTNEYRLPNIKFETLQELLVNELDKNVITNIENYNKQGIIEFFKSTLSSYIVNLRKLYRVLNSFCFQYYIFRKAHLMVNIEDLFYLSVLKVMNLSLYNKLWMERKEIFSFNKYLLNQEEQQAYDNKYIIGSIKKDSLTNTELSILNKLFKSQIEKYDIKRLRDENHFDLYFQGNIPQSQIEVILEYLNNPSLKDLNELQIKIDDTLLSDIQDIMFSNFYIENRNLDFVFALFSILIKYPLIAKKVYIDESKFYFNYKEKYIKEYNEEKIAEFINANKENCDINMLEWLLCDAIVLPESKTIYKMKELSEQLEKERECIIETLKQKLIKTDLKDIYTINILIRLVETYKLGQIVKSKLIQYLNENDNTIVELLHHFTNRGFSSNNGAFYILSILDLIKKFNLTSQFKERLLVIKTNEIIMNDKAYINYYASQNDHFDLEKQHIIDKLLEEIDK